MRRIVVAVAAVVVIVVIAYFLFAPSSNPTVAPVASSVSGPAAAPVTSFAKGSAQNLAASQADFSGKAWIREGVSVTPNAAAAPDGTNSAYRVALLGSGGNTRVDAVVLGLKPGDTYTTSIYFKPADLHGIFVEMRDSEGGQYGTALFDLAQQAVQQKKGAVTNIGLQRLPDGWFRGWAAMPYKTDAAVINVNLINPSNSGNGAGAPGPSLLLWGVQFEAGTEATGYNAQ